MRFPSPRWQIVGRAVALRLGKARAAGTPSNRQFAPKHFNTVKALVLGFIEAQPVKQALSQHAQASAQH